MVNIREFHYPDLTDVIRIWNCCLPLTPVDEPKIAQVLFADVNFLSSSFLIAEQDDCVVGFIIGIQRLYPYLSRGLEKDNAWILAMAVAPECQRQSIGSHLLQTLENRWHSQGIFHITLCTFSPYYFFPGIHQDNKPAAHFFQKHKYQQGNAAYWMERSFADFSIPQNILECKRTKEKEGYFYRSFIWQDALPLLDFVKKNFSVGWYLHIRQAIMNAQAPELIQLCLFQDNIVGYIQRKMDGNPFRLGPFGISKEHRNGGVGTILLYQMWQSMVDQGLNSVFFQSTDEPGRRFYERQGMTVTHTYFHYEKH